jgi:hypothetical protein
MSGYCGPPVNISVEGVEFTAQFGYHAGYISSAPLPDTGLSKRFGLTTE